MSKSHNGMIGYHSENQSNFSSLILVSSSGSGGGGMFSVETVDDDDVGDDMVKTLNGVDVIL